METIVLKVEGMKCGGCESMVKSSLEAVEGVRDARVSHQAKQVEIDFEPELTSIDQLKEVISGQGYTVGG